MTALGAIALRWFRHCRMSFLRMFDGNARHYVLHRFGPAGNPICLMYLVGCLASCKNDTHWAELRFILVGRGYFASASARSPLTRCVHHFDRSLTCYVSVVFGELRFIFGQGYFALASANTVLCTSFRPLAHMLRIC